MTINVSPNANTTPSAKSRFSQATQDKLDLLEAHLSDIGLRFELIANVLAELQHVAREKPIAINGHSFWRLVLAERDMIVIDLASWPDAVEVFLREMPPADLRALRKTWDYDVTDDQHYVRENPAWRVATFARLFPTVSAETPTPKDIKALRKRLESSHARLETDRNQHRAHKAEVAVRASVTSKALNLDEVRTHLNLCADLVRDIYCLARNCSWGGMHVRDPEKGHPDAEGIVDLALFTTVSFLFDVLDNDPTRERRFYRDRREALYSRLHAQHEANGNPLAAFNDPTVLVP